MHLQLPESFEFLLEPKRYKVMYGGRGGAKSHGIARCLLWLGMEKPLRIICAREIQKSIKDSVHALLADLIRSHGLSSFYTVQEAIIRGVNGTEFKFRGLKHNTTDMKSLEGADIAWLEEAENISSSSYEILIPTIRKENSEIWVSFNTKNVTDPTYMRFVARQDDDTICKKVSWRDNPFFPAILNKERLKLLHDDPEAYQHVWEGGPDIRRSGAIYGKQIVKMREEGRICKVPYNPAFEVFTAWDLGYGKGNATTIWFLQFVGRELRWLEYYEREGEFTPHFAQVVKDRAYNYMARGHFIPHDGAADNVRGASVSTQLSQLGVQTTVLDRAANEAKIQAERGELSSILEYSVFDEEKTKDGIFALESYHFEWNDDRGRFGDKPYHDWSSNGADSARYAAVAITTKLNHISAKQKKIVNRNHSGGWMGG